MGRHVYSKLDINEANATVWKFYDNFSSYYDEICAVSVKSKQNFIGLVYKNQVNSNTYRSIELFETKILTDNRVFCDFFLGDREVEYYVTADSMENCLIAFKKNVML